MELFITLSGFYLVGYAFFYFILLNAFEKKYEEKCDKNIIKQTFDCWYEINYKTIHILTVLFWPVTFIWIVTYFINNTFKTNKKNETY